MIKKSYACEISENNDSFISQMKTITEDHIFRESNFTESNIGY